MRRGASGQQESTHGPDVEARVQDVAWAVGVARRVVPAATCLVQALAADRMLRARGVVAELKIGVPPHASGEFEAHAWLEWEGRVVVGDREDLARFALLPDLPRERG